MSVLKEIKKAQLQARKDKDKFKAGILTALMSEVSIVGKNQGIDETLDADALKVVTKFKKGTNDNIRLFRNSGKNARDIAPLLLEVEIYDSFLPKQMSEDELRNTIKEIIEVNKLDGKSAMGHIMKKLKELYDGEYDGKMASMLTKELLN